MKVAPALDVERIRADFPILKERVNGHPLVYLDSAATSQKPESVIQAISDYYRFANANVHRGVHALASLSEGELHPSSCTVECPLHGSQFDLRTGDPTSLPAVEPVAVHPVEVREGEVWVELEP